MTLPRIGVLGMWQETNSWSPRRTSLASFQEFELLAGEDLRLHNKGVGTVISGFLECEEIEAVPIFSAGAWPAAPPDAETLRALLHRLRLELGAAGELDGVLINLHGAMTAEGTVDVESATVDLVREAVGAVPIGVVLDLHANVSPSLIDLVDVAISYDTYPHVDMHERGDEAARLIARCCRGEDLITVVAKTPLLTCPLAQATDEEPMHSLMLRARERAETAGVDRVCVTAGFPYSDTPAAGFSVLVVASVDDRETACQVADATVADIEGSAAAFAVARPSPEAAVEQAMLAGSHPVVLADVADNVGGGGAGDGTAILAELLRQRAPDALVIIADADVATEAHRLGTGRRFTGEVGAKSDELHGSPVMLKDAVISQLHDGVYVTSGSWQTGQQFSMGPTALLVQDGIHVVVTTKAVPPFHREQVTCVGVDPSEVSVIAAKGAVAWRAAYPDARTSIEVDGPGACPIDIGLLKRRYEPVGRSAR